MTSRRASALAALRRTGAAMVIATMVATGVPAPARAAPAEVPAEADGAGDAPEPDGEDVEAAPARDGPTEPAPSIEPPADPMRDRLIEEAAHHFQEATRLVDTGDYEAAATEFERSYGAIRTDKALYNAGLSYEKAGEPVQAIRAARRYLDLPDCDEPKADPIHCARRRDQVEQTVRRLMRKVGVLTLVIEPGVELREVQVQDRTVPLSDFPLVLAPGPVEVTLLGPKADDRRVRIARLAAGDETRLYVGPFEDPVPPRPPRAGNDDEERRGDDPPRIDPERRQAILRGVFWGGLAGTLASGTALAVLGGLTLHHKQTFEENNPGPTYPSENEEQFDRYRPPTNAMIGVTAALGLVTVVVGLFAFSKRDQPGQRASTQTTRTRVRFTGSGLAGRF